MNRRTFLAATASSAARVLGANDRIRGAVIGAGGRGRYLTQQFKEIGVEMAAVCDVYEPNLRKGLEVAATTAQGYANYERLLEDQSIDVVIVATPDHWHSRMVIDAVEAGKDVYVEKPMAHTIEEGFAVIEATRRAGRIVQVGTQRRSSPFFLEARSRMSEIGKVHLVNSWWLNYVTALRRTPLEGKLDWERWLGPAPKRELDPVRFRNWYYFWDYSGGMLTGQGAHIIDAINMFMGSSFPSAVTCAAGRVNVDGAEIPETASMSIEYPGNFLAVFTIGYKAMRYRWFNDQLKQFHGTEARLDVAREWYKLWPQSDDVPLRPSLEVDRAGSFEPATRAHIRNFLESVKSRRDPSATVEMGQWTNVALCLAMESIRAGRRLRFNQPTKRIEA